MKRIIISISAAIVVLSVLFYVLDKNIIKFKNAKIKDAIGESVESEYEQKVRLIAIAVKRKIAIEDKKIDFLLRDVDLEQKLSYGETLIIFNDYVDSHEQCERIRVINQNLELVFSTAENDLLGSKLDKVFYGRILTDSSPLIIDLLEKTIIFSKGFSTEGKDSYWVLFYYNRDLLHSLFQKIETLHYIDYLFAQENLILLNFPEISSGDEVNIERMLGLMSDKSSGAIRVVMKSADVTVYYDSVDKPYNEFTVGLAVASEELGLSKVGIVLLISQAVVVLSLLIFVFIIIKQKRGFRERRGAKASEETDVLVENEEETPGQGNIPFGEEIRAPEAGVVSLSNVEEMAEVEEIGEAEVAELEGFEDGDTKELMDGQPKAPDGNAKVTEKKKDTGGIEKEESVVKQEKHSEVKSSDHSLEGSTEGKIRSSGNGKEQLKGMSLNREETIENDLPSIENKKSLPDLEKLVNNIEKKSSISDVKAEQEGANKSTTRKAIKQKVMVKEPQKAEEIIVPEEVYKQKDKQYRDDELTYLIDKMEQVDETGTLIEKEEGIYISEKELNTLEKVLDKFLQNLALSKGALLVRDGTGVYSVALARGLSEQSVNKLKFDGSERVYKNIIAKRKLLFIKEDVFIDNEIREKFDISDAEKIRSLFIAPIGDADSIRGIMLVCITMEERILSEIITKEINKIIKTIKRYI